MTKKLTYDVGDRVVIHEGEGKGHAIYDVVVTIPGAFGKQWLDVRQSPVDPIIRKRASDVTLAG